MPIWHAVVLGIIQGLTEFLPVSSSAHLAVLPYLVGWKDQGLAFDIALHFGTLVAVLAYFFKDWVQVIAQGFGLRAGTDTELQENRMLLWLLVLATIPAGVIGLLFEEKAEAAGNNLYLVGSMLIVMGLFMGWADRMARKYRDIRTVGVMDSLLIGCAQALAVVPGTSRSGTTISIGLLRGLDRHAAARFSFLLSTPIIGGAAAKKFIDLFETGIPQDEQMAFAVGIIVSGITGALAIKYFMAYLRNRSLDFFVAYRVVFGIIVIALAFFRS